MHCPLPVLVRTVKHTLTVLKTRPCRAVFGASYLQAARGGPRPPGTVEHADGGVYRGEWAGARKAGLGVYRYPSGAQYAGQWADNGKHGLGVYTFPKARSGTAGIL